jgi:hypothetical protein
VAFSFYGLVEKMKFLAGFPSHDRFTVPSGTICGTGHIHGWNWSLSRHPGAAA